LLRDNSFPLRGRQRAAGVLAALGEREAIPTLLDAISREDVNQAYFARLVSLEPNALKKQLLRLINDETLDMLLTTNPQLAAYFATLLITLRDVDGQRDIASHLEGLSVNAKDWRVRAAAEAALAP
jgi:hypothetical protein